MTDVVIAIDIGGTGIKCAIVETATGAGDDGEDARRVGEIRHVERHPTHAERGPEAVIETIVGVAGSLADRARLDGFTPRAVGMVAPGVIDEAAGIAVWAANVGFRSVPMRDLVEKHIGLPAALGHDVRAGAIAEARLGAGRGVARVWFVAIGTGIAAAYVRDGRTDSGAHGSSGEIGHVVVRPDGPECGCGLRGCVESIASASAVARRYRERTGEAATAAEIVARANAFEMAAGDTQTGATRNDATRYDDATARAIWLETIDVLADGLRIGVTLYDPDVIVVGGGLAEAGDALLLPLDAALRAGLTFQTMPRLVRATLGDEAGCLGAALLARELVTT